jgi:hypothetical protein
MNEIKFDTTLVPVAWVLHAARLRGRVLACEDASDPSAELFLLRRFDWPARIKRSGSGRVSEAFARRLRANVIVECMGDGQVIVRASPRNLRAIQIAIRDKIELHQFLELLRRS